MKKLFQFTTTMTILTIIGCTLVIFNFFGIVKVSNVVREICLLIIFLNSVFILVKGGIKNWKKNESQS